MLCDGVGGRGGGGGGGGSGRGRGESGRGGGGEGRGQLMWGGVEGVAASSMVAGRPASRDSV